MEIKFDAEAVMIPHYIYDNEDKDLIKSAMIEFARIHVERALKKASETKYPYWGTAKISWENRNSTDVDMILNSYPLKNIK